MTKTRAISILAVAVLAVTATPAFAQNRQEITEAEAEATAAQINRMHPHMAAVLYRSLGYANAGRMEARTGAGAVGTEDLGIYGGIDFANHNGQSQDEQLEYEGNATNYRAGIDVPLGYDSAAGIFLNKHDSSLDIGGRYLSVRENYADGATPKPFLPAHYGLNAESIHGYVSMGNGLGRRIWLQAGVGRGEASYKIQYDRDTGPNHNIIAESDEGRYDTDVFFFGGGFREDLSDFVGVGPSARVIVDGFVSGTEIDLEPETWEYDGLENNPWQYKVLQKSSGQSVRTRGNAARLGVSYLNQQQVSIYDTLDTYASFAGNGVWSPDEEGIGYEAAAGLDYRHQDRTVMGGKVRYLEIQNHKEVGFAGNFILTYEVGGLGFAAKVEPSYGSASPSEWGRQDFSSLNLTSAARLDAEFGYGLAVNGGVLQPYGGYQRVGSDREYALGFKLNQGDQAWQLGYTATNGADADSSYELTYKFL